jgi:hypothetical protein
MQPGGDRVINVDLRDLRGRGAHIHGHPVFGVEENLAAAMRYDTLDELADAITRLTWIDDAEDGENSDIPPGTSWYTTVAILDGDTDEVHLAYVEGHRIDGGVVVLAPSQDDGPRRSWFANEIPVGGAEGVA